MPEQLSISSWRREKGYTQEALAQQLGVSIKTLSEWENRNVPIKPLYIYAIAYVLRVDADKIKP